MEEQRWELRRLLRVCGPDSLLIQKKILEKERYGE